MKAIRRVALLLAMVSPVGWAQSRITIPAGTPEDQAVQAIDKEPDAGKRAAMWDEFVQKFSANPHAVAYGNWQLSQNFQTTGDLPKALEYGDKALAVMPDNLEILVSQAGIAQQMKSDAKVLDYAVRGGAVMASFDATPRPEGMSESDFANQQTTRRAGWQQSVDFLEVAGYNALTQLQDPKATIAAADRFLSAFPQSRFKKSVTALALMALQKNNDIAGLSAYADKLLGPNPDDPEMLNLLANAFAEDAKSTHLNKAGAYARKAIELTKNDPAKSTATGFSHMVLGYVLMKEENTPAAITELKLATTLLKEDPADLAIAYYRLGFAHAKLKQYAEARAALNEAMSIPGPVQSAAKDLLDRVNAAAKQAKR